jgi:short-subunit dehydrogenase
MEKMALITGASKGIGKALAEVFARNGYSLLLVARNTAELTQLQMDLKNKYQCESKILSADLARQDSVDLIMNTFKDEISRLDVLVNNAGFGAAKKLTDMSAEEVSGMMEVNMAALTKLAYKVLPFMVARKSGKILNLASTAAFAPGPYMAIYYASKAYILSLSQALAEEFHQDGITISVLCPGMTTTEFHSRAGTDKTYIFAGFIPKMTAASVAEIGYNGLMRGRLVIVAGIMNKISIFMMWLTPSFLAAKVTGFLDKPKSS